MIFKKKKKKSPLLVTPFFFIAFFNVHITNVNHAKFQTESLIVEQFQGNYTLKQYFGRPDQPSSGLDVTKL